MLTMGMKSILIILLGAIFFFDAGLSLPPSYNEQYAKVRYQPHDDLRKAELNLEERDREEVTEKNRKHTPDNMMIDGDLFEVTTEQESEQINIARFVHRNIVKDKLIEKKDRSSDGGPEELLPSREKKNNNSSAEVDGKKAEKDREETTSKADLVEEFSAVEIKSDVKDQQSSAELYDKSELNDLNQEGPYHIYHPSGSYRKTVFNAENHLTQFQLPSDVKYVPIVESIYTYDPRTFIFQRLLLRT